MTSMNAKVAQQLDYRWHRIQRLQRSKIPKSIYPWLATDQSITAKLRCAGQLKVELLEERWGVPTPRERLRLGLKDREVARIRTVVLHVDGIPVVYARSIMPARSLRGSWRYLPYLKNRPLGGYVYRSGALKRSPIEVAQLPAGILKEYPDALWARRSIFMEFGPGILVNEAFYPSIGKFTSLAGRF